MHQQQAFPAACRPESSAFCLSLKSKQNDPHNPELVGARAWAGLTRTTPADPSIQQHRIVSISWMRCNAASLGSSDVPSWNGRQKPCYKKKKRCIYSYGWTYPQMLERCPHLDCEVPAQGSTHTYTHGEEEHAEILWHRTLVPFLFCST